MTLPHSSPKPLSRGKRHLHCDCFTQTNFIATMKQYMLHHFLFVIQLVGNAYVPSIMMMGLSLALKLDLVLLLFRPPPPLVGFEASTPMMESSTTK